MKKLFSSLLFCLAPVVCAEAGTVSVSYDHETINFDSQPRISVLLSVLNDKSRIYWPMAKLYQVDSKLQSDLVANKQVVLEDLRQLIIMWHHQQTVSQQLSALRREIESWQLGVVVDTPLDFDLTQLRQEHNPVLDSGSYILSASKRTNYVTVVALGGRSDVVYRNNKAAYQYLQEADYSAEVKDVDEVFYVPNQSLNSNFEVESISVSFWNNTEQPLLNGSVLFVPISADILTEQYAKLNEQIVQLAQYRIVQ